MRLTEQQQIILQGVIEQLRLVGVPQKDIARRANIKTDNISKAKRGKASISEQSWRNIYDAIEEIIQERRNASDRVAERSLTRALGAIRNLKSGLTVVEPVFLTDALQQDHDMESAYGMYQASVDRFAGMSTFPITGSGIVIQNKGTESILSRDITRTVISLSGENRPQLGRLPETVAGSAWIAESVAVIEVSPFALVGARRFTWGVIRYAYLRKVGVILPNTVFEYLGASTNQDFMDLPALLDIRGLFIWIHGKAWVGEVLNEELVSRGVVDYISAFHDSCRRGEEMKKEGKCSIECALIEMRNGKRGAVFFDLPDDPEVPKQFSGHVKKLEYRHNVRVPVGVGFTSTALPWLAHNHRWRSIQKAAAKAALKEGCSAGIEVDDTLL